MKYSDLKAGMKIRAVADYGGCIAKGLEYEVVYLDHDFYIECAIGQHDLKEMADVLNGDLPEFEPA